MPKKRRRRDPRPGELIAESVQPPTSNAETAQVIQDVQTPIVESAQVHEDVQSPTVEPAQVDEDDQSPTFVEDFFVNEETFASGSSSAPPSPEHDVASIMLAKLLAFQDSIPRSRGKGIHIGSGQRGDEDSQQTIFELRQEILILKQESIEKDLLIGKLDVRVSELEKENS
ncbi:unnamed protein product [Lactuca virosa]|uniref:Uncharacterized protein n=1 Tax=Lactuca virosa TaxID=75947 RepID=A0AAU9P937_9ASTR|nr:unnamed protein product [Lactuca virosa]